MNFNEYQKLALTTAINHDSPNEIYHLALGLAGETGEVMEKLKKVVRDNNAVITPEKAIELQKELGDILWYMAVFADYLGIEFDDVARMNVEKLQDRKKRNVLSGSGDNR
nr:MAG TPA: NTP-PPase-like protein [Caudoviricetes sp.]